MVLTTSIEIGDPQSINNGQKTADRSKRFSMFHFGYLMIEHCNFSLIPYYYDSKYGAGHRVFSVIYRHNKLRLFLYCMQLLYLFIWLCRTAYNGFDLCKYFDVFQESSIKNDDEECPATILLSLIRRLCLALIKRLLTYDLWGPIAEYRRRMNLLTFTFILQSFSQKFYCLIRHQKPKIHRPKIIGNPGVSEINLIKEFLFSFKLSIREYILYFFLFQPLPEYLVRENPMLKETTKKDIIEFNLMAIYDDKGILCTSKSFVNFIRLATVGVPMVLFSTIFSPLIPMYLVDIYRKDTHIHEIGLSDYLESCNMFLLTFYFISTFIDSFVLAAFAHLLSDRIFIYNTQLVAFIAHLRAMRSHNIKTRNHYCEGQQSILYHDDNKNNEQVTRNNRFRTTRKSPHMNYNPGLMLFKNKVTLLPSSSKVTARQSLDAQCERLIKDLHQLLFELKLLKELFTKRTDLDILISLCSYTWVLGTWLVAFKCETCVTKWPLLLIIMGSNIYLFNVINQIFFMARLADKVSCLS